MSKALAVRGTRGGDPAILDKPFERAAGSLTQALDAWDVLQPLLVDVLKEVGVEVRRGVQDGFDILKHDGKTGVAYSAKYVSRKDGEEIGRDAWIREVGNDLVTWTEKIAKTLAAMTKATDEAARLKEFLCGGEETRPDLSNCSDGELIETLIQVAIARGLVNEIVKRARAAGQEIGLG